jgi:hypothetical protein
MSVKWWEQASSVLVSSNHLAEASRMLKSLVAGSILRALDSVGLSILYWIFGFIIAASTQTLLCHDTIFFANRR